MKRILHFALFTILMLSLSFVVSAQTMPDQKLIEKGKYLAIVGDCTACHTIDKSKPFAGGYEFHLPMGTIVVGNITPSKEFGIGNWSEAQFGRAICEGVSADGRRLYPAMPYTEYSILKDEDITALYAYFMHGVKPVEQAPQNKTKLEFPFNIPGTMSVWNMLYLDNKRFQPDASKSDEINYGRYLADGLGHCTTCHTPRNSLMALDKSEYLAGGFVDGWYVPNLTPDVNSGLGGWSDDEILSYLKNGHTKDKA